MKKLEITKGDFIANNTYVDYRGTGNDLCFLGNSKYANGKIITFPEMRGNAKLFADSLNTYQECELLPSELLRQNKELREALEGFVKLKDLCIYTREIQPQHEGEAIAINNALNKAEQALKP